MFVIVYARFALPSQFVTYLLIGLCDFVVVDIVANFDGVVCINMSRSASCADKRQWAFKFVTTLPLPGQHLVSGSTSYPTASPASPASPSNPFSGLSWMSFGCHQTKSHMKFAMYLECAHGTGLIVAKHNATNQDWWPRWLPCMELFPSYNSLKCFAEYCHSFQLKQSEPHYAGFSKITAIGF